MAMSKQQEEEVVDNEQQGPTQRRHAAGRPVPVYKLQETVVNIVVITTVTKSNKTRAPPPLPALFLVKRTSLQ
jgi:predicted transcriptional regulator